MSGKVDRKQIKTNIKQTSEIDNWLKTALDGEKEELAQLTKEYGEELDRLKKAYELGKKDILDTLATAEDAYATALKTFTDKYGSFHLTLKDGDFETTISSETTKKYNDQPAIDLFRLIFGI